MSAILNSDKLLKTFDRETEEFYDNTIDLFMGLREGHMGRYCFSSAKFPNDPVCGDKHWTNFIKTNTGYYPYHDQVEIISQFSQSIGSIVADAGIFVDLGTGSLNSFEKKILPIIRTAKFSEIKFVDLCKTFSKQATSRLQEERLLIKTSSFIGNFFINLPTLSGKAVINLFGITLGNIAVDIPFESPDQVLARTMKHFAAPLSEYGGYFIFDYDSNMDEKTIHASYEHPSYHAMEMTILERMKRDLPTRDFYPDNFEHVTAWHPQWGLLAQELRAKVDIRFSVGPYKIDIPRGKTYRTGNSFKYTDETVEAAAVNAGFKRAALFSLPNTTMRVAVFAV